MGTFALTHTLNEDNVDDIAKSTKAENEDTFLVCSAPSLGGFFLRIFFGLFAISFGIIPSIQRQLGGGSFSGDGSVLSIIFITCSVLSSIFTGLSWFLLLSTSLASGQRFLDLARGVLALPKVPMERTFRERRVLPPHLQRAQIPLTRPGFLDNWIAMRKITVAHARTFLSSDSSAFGTVFLFGMAEMGIYLTAQVFESTASLATASAQGVVQNGTATSTAYNNATFDAGSISLATGKLNG